MEVKTHPRSRDQGTSGSRFGLRHERSLEDWLDGGSSYGFGNNLGGSLYSFGDACLDGSHLVEQGERTVTMQSSYLIIHLLLNGRFHQT